MATVRVPAAGLASQYRADPGATAGWTTEASAAGVAALRTYAPVDRGYLRGGFRAFVLGGPRGPVVRYEADVDYALYQEVGTGIYGPLGRRITPRTAKALAWIDRNTGERRFARSVRGNRPKRYFRTAFYVTFGPDNVRYYGAAGP